MEILLGWQRTADAAVSGELTKATVLKTLNEILERATGERLEVATVEKFFIGWLKGKSVTGKSVGTTARYASVLKNFRRFLGDKRVRSSIAGITASDIEAFRDDELARGKSASSADLAVKILSAVLNDAKRKGLILANPATAVELIAGPSNERKPFSDEEIAALLRVADVPWRGMILLAAHAGLRIGDAAKLRWSSVDLSAETLKFTAQKTTRRKHGKPQTIAMHPEVTGFFEALPSDDDPEGPLFPSLASKVAGGHQGLSNAFSKIMDAAGIRGVTTVKKEGQGRRFSELSFHSLRHAFISRLANADIGPDVRKEFAGHSSDEIHRRYTHLDLGVQRRALARLKPYLKK